MVKANAYGHGDFPIAQECMRLGAVGVGVADLDEAEHLRSQGFKGPILSFGILDEDTLQLAIKTRTWLTLHTLEEIEILCKSRLDLDNPIPVHIEIETGMHRLGLVEKDWGEAALKLFQIKGIEVHGIFTHFAESEHKDPTFTQSQILKFKKAISIFEKQGKRALIRHIANSGGILSHPKSHLDWIRPGIALYGYPPIDSESEFKPVLQWHAKLIQIKQIASGDSVGYNRTFRASQSMRIGTVAVGYGDGYHRSYKSVGVVYQGKRCPVLGLICMDLLMIDLTHVPNAKVGEEVLLLSQTPEMGPTALDLAKAMGSIPYEVLTSIHRRVQREYV